MSEKVTNPQAQYLPSDVSHNKKLESQMLADIKERCNLCGQKRLQSFLWYHTLTNYLEYLLARNLQLTTIEQYISGICAFLEHRATTTGLRSGVKEITLEQELTYLGTFKSTTRYCVSIYLRSFFQYALDAGHLSPECPLIHYRLPKPQRRKITPLTDEEIQKIHDYVYSRQGRSALRERVLFELLVSWAPRANELACLKWTDFTEHTLTFVQKGKSLRSVSVTEELYQALKAWQNVCSQGIYIFRTNDSRASRITRPYDRSSISKAIKGWFKACGIERISDSGAHIWRHTLATKVFNMTSNIETTRRFMAHRNIETTIGYVHVAESDISMLATKIRKGVKKE